LDENLIRKAILLAKHSRLNVDVYYDPYEFDLLQEENLVNQIKNEINSNSIKYTSNNVFYIPKKNYRNRKSIYIPFKQYVIRYLIGLIIFNKIGSQFSENIFGGKEDVFLTQKTDSFEEFLNWQHKINKDTKYKYLILLDIKSYFESVDHDVLIKKVMPLLDVKENSYIIELVNSTLKFAVKEKNTNDISINEKSKGLVIGSNIDHFLQNIVLLELDGILNTIENIAYGRLTDDFRIFCSTKKSGEEIIKTIKQELDKYGLSLNKDKTGWVNLLKYEIPTDQISYFIGIDGITKFSEIIINNESIFTLLNSTNLHDYYKYSVLRTIFLDKEGSNYAMLNKNPIFQQNILDTLRTLIDSNNYILKNTSEYIMKKYFKP
jgi:hypothetical protein